MDIQDRRVIKVNLKKNIISIKKRIANLPFHISGSISFECGSYTDQRSFFMRSTLPS